MKEKLTVNNIKCGGCEASIKDSLSKIQGVNNIAIDSSTGEVAFEYIEKSSLEKVRFKLHKMGYTENDPTLLDTAKSYVSCAIGRMK